MKTFDDLVKTVKILRSPKGCPWDREQTIDNYKKYLLEETYELIDEINRKKTAAAEEEIGDLFLILVILSEMFREKGHFDLQSILRKINQKLITRHPHVFGSKKLNTKEEVLSYWIKTKAKKKKRKTIKDRLPREAPALLLADIFFKEYSHIYQNKNQSQIQKANTLIRNINSAMKEIGHAKKKTEVFCEAMLQLCQLAHMYHLDTENLLRAKIFKKASRITYGTLNTKK
ncbi:MAG: MazG nucleotide pyrophosphohydrolase domain-containing protein [Candidatus Omnitrophota bacterium]